MAILEFHFFPHTIDATDAYLLTKCRREAKRQLIAALADTADNAITGWRWQDQRSGMTAVMDSRSDYPSLSILAREGAHSAGWSF
jgi:hypothetical protein